MHSPFFSIILPTYNRARMLRSALKSVLYQTERDWECLVIDDGSTDKTQEVLARFDWEPRLRVFTSPQNWGMNHSRNLAINEAQGRYITFLDSDDLWLPARLEEFRRRLERGPEASFVFSNAYVWRFERIIGTLFDPAREIPEGKVPGHYAVGDSHLPYVTTNVAIATEAFREHGKFKTEMKTLDTELFARFLAAGLPVGVIKTPLSLRRLHGDQLTGDRHRENFRESMLALEASGASPEVRAKTRRKVACEVALYLVKAGQPKEAREFLDEALGAEAPSTAAWKLGALPSWLLIGLAAARRTFLQAKNLPFLLPEDQKAALRAVAPLLAEERLP